ncbi:hypothetical protein LTR09_004046 [Extremus antarcticus]|uniref:Tr-type G domain-containing protein n=1 Tax=Extremus antarcticus TaxID=702011 RepID=A0AAJ0DIS8_9PEZI|nr:hypothetical protein LTR09_004046 [Extremus antarcticus]
MASIFTFESETPRVASPWLQDRTDDDGEQSVQFLDPGVPLSISGSSTPHSQRLRLPAEPQEGPVEYKLHLLLRPRRKFRSTSTGSHVSGSKHSNIGAAHNGRSFSESVMRGEQKLGDVTPLSTSMQQTRQHRLEQLTTQLLWRLQQSSPHHSSSATNIILPALPEALPELHAPQQPGKLLHGLEESQGALYEIGVSDDGTLVGLADDEMEESLNNLRAMAACLGCVVEVLRKEHVGDCEWVEDAVDREARRVQRTGLLSVVEAFVKPYLRPGSSSPSPEAMHEPGSEKYTTSSDHHPSPATEQLRVTMTGATMSGKSTLLGTLTTSTLDNGRGKSRLSMLKHRHEITSGVTSSVTQELIGFRDTSDGNLEVLNYAVENTASWIDVHVAAHGNRLVFISDSAGHPRYRRTTVRGLVGWAPHWTLLCIPADDVEDTAGKLGSTQTSQLNIGAIVPDMDLSGAQLDLCLRLNLPMVIVVTKLDLASRSGLKQSLSKVLDAVKASGKQPAILKNLAVATSEFRLQTVDSSAIENAYHAAVPLLNDPLTSVPIVLTSAVQGTGIDTLQALLHELPIVDARQQQTAHTSSFTFHVEDHYSKPAEADSIIVSGLLRSGQISVGDTGTLGPFSVHDMEDSEDSEDRPVRRTSAHLPTSRSFPGALRHARSSLSYFQLPNQEWRRFRVKSIRNLRLPVHSLVADQVGTLAIVPEDANGRMASTGVFGRIRKGMVLTAVQPQTTRSFDAEFAREDLAALAIGNHVVVYVCSVRASAKVVSARAPDPPSVSRDTCSNGHGPFDMEDVAIALAGAEIDGQNEKVAGMVTAPSLIVTFSFDASKEYIELGAKVLVMPGGGPGLYGGHGRGEKGFASLDSFVGTVVNVYP